MTPNQRYDSRKKGFVKITAKGVLEELATLGTGQNREIYRCHGAGEGVHGISFANLIKLHNRIKTDHQLAQKLRASGNHEVRLMIADPGLADEDFLEAWGNELGDWTVGSEFGRQNGTVE